MSNFKCDEIDPSAPEEAAAAQYWPPDQAMRLECLRLATEANQHAKASDILNNANDFFAFVRFGSKDYGSLIQSLETNVTISCSKAADAYAEKARAAGKEDAAKVADQIAELIISRV